MKLLEWAGALFRWLAGAVVPMFVRPVSPLGLAWFLHAVLVAGVTVGLFYVEREAGLRDYIGRGPPELKKFWLPALFVLVYLLAWAVRWWILLLAPGQPTTEFPDLDIVPSAGAYLPIRSSSFFGSDSTRIIRRCSAVRKPSFTAWSRKPVSRSK